MKKIFIIGLCVLLMLSVAGCSSPSKNEQSPPASASVEAAATPKSDPTAPSTPIPEYVLVNTEDVSTNTEKRIEYWVATKGNISRDEASAIAFDVVKPKSEPGEHTVYIYDSEEGAESGLISNKMFDVKIVFGTLLTPVENEMYGA